MSIGSKETYTEAQKRKAEHIEESYEAKGVSPEKAKQIAWEEQSISALRSKARKKRINGRSTMNKVELIMALRQARSPM
ncbi:MAG: hypothetical protein U1B30_02055 [Pseudomonadota bacterium]|nr:hypothetical protein [Pseudomonadota bacterium]